MNYEPFTSIENPTLAHFRHFSSLFTPSPLYICRERSTNQLLFMQNKPNFRKSQMNVSIYLQKDYENISDWTLGENKPNSNPIKPNFQKAKMNVNSLITKDYRKNDAFTVRKNKPNSNPISEKAKMSANVFITKDYENKTAFRPKKTNPNKPNGLKESGAFFDVLFLPFLPNLRTLTQQPPLLAQKQEFTPKIRKNLKNSNCPPLWKI